MPIHVYKCQICNKTFEFFHMTREDLDVKIHCDCGSVNVEKQLTTWGNYGIEGNNSSSVTPKGKGFKNAPV